MNSSSTQLQVPDGIPLAPNQSAVQLGALVDEPAQELDGTLEFEATPIGQGGYSEVYRAIWSPIDGSAPRQVCVKVLNNQPGPTAPLRSRQRILREAIIMGRINHTNIVKFLGVTHLNLKMAIVTEYCANGDLKEYVSRNLGAIDMSRKLDWLHQLATGLRYLHNRPDYPVFHGDIKPENVLVLDSLQAAWSDFGISRISNALGLSTGLTTSNPGGGSPGFTAPEQLFNEDRRLTPASDVYGFAGLILWVFSGNGPYHQLIKRPALMYTCIHKGEVPGPADHPGLPSDDEWWPFLVQCWSTEPSDRPTLDQVIERVQARRQTTH